MPAPSDATPQWVAVADLAAGLASDTAARSAYRDGLEDAVTDALPALAQAIGADVVVLALRTSERRFRLAAATGLAAGDALDWDEFDVSAAVPLAAAARTGKAQWLADVAAARSTFPALGDGLSVSAAALPLLADGTVVGTLGVGYREQRDFDEVQRASLHAVAALMTAAFGRGRPSRPDRLHRHDHASQEGATIACLTRDDGARCTVARARPGSRRGSNSVFASLLDADPELPPGTLERVSGVLGLCRRWRLPPARVGQAVAEISEDLDGAITGAHIEIATDTGWLAAAPLDAAVIVTSTPAGQGTPTAPSEGVLAGERLVLAGTDAAAVLAVALDVRTEAGPARTIRDIATRLTAGGVSGDAHELLGRLEAELGSSETSPCVRGALAVVLPPRPEQANRIRTLPAQPVSATIGRHFAVAALPEDASADVAGDVALVTSELLSNAVRHAYDDVEITITDEPEGTRIAVTDDDDRAPDRPAARTGAGAASGRGMTIVEAVADEVGITPHLGGKSVWALVKWRRPNPS